MITLERYTVNTVWAGAKNCGSEVIDTKDETTHRGRKPLCQCDSPSLALRIAHMLNDEHDIYEDLSNQLDMLVDVHRVRSLNSELPTEIRTKNHQVMEAYDFVRGFIQKANNRRNLT